jgi:ribosomal 50S subunit-recycling heat shock protein
MKVGDKIEIQYQHKHAQFQVSWINSRRGSSSSQKEIGAECLEPEKQVWGTDFPQQVDEYEEQD